MRLVEASKSAVACPVASSDRTWERLINSSVVQQFQMAFANATGLPVTMLSGPTETCAKAPEPSGGFCIDGCLGPHSGQWCLRTLQGAERKAVTAAIAAPLNPLALAYLNRLSDWLFVAARHANGQGRDDILWVPGASR